MSDAHTPSPLPPAPPSSFRGRGCARVALVGCGAVAALIVLILVAGGIWWSRNHDELQGSVGASAREGARFGLVRDEEGCFEEGKRRAAQATDITSQFGVGAFVRACLEYSRPTPGYCDNVPPPTSIGRSAAWQSQRCGDNVQCRTVSQVVQTYCHEGRPKRTAADTLLMDASGGPGAGAPTGGWSGRSDEGGPASADTGATAEAVNSSRF